MDGRRIIGMNMASLLLLLAVCVVPLHVIEAADHPILYLFWGENCPHCQEEKEFLQILKEDFPQLEMRWFEVWEHPEFAKLADTLRRAHDIKIPSVPMTFLGDWGTVGFQSFETTGTEIAEKVAACIEHGCPDALDTVGPQRIVEAIREDARSGAPTAWQYFPPLKPVSNPVVSESRHSDKVVVYYFHGTARCSSCVKIERYTREAVEEGFASELDNGALEFQTINVDQSVNQHFLKDYRLYTKSVIVSDVAQGKESRWKNLSKVWELLHKKSAFKKYIRTEITAYLKGKQL